MVKASQYIENAIKVALNSRSSPWLRNNEAVAVDVIRQSGATRRQLRRLRRTTSIIWRMRAGYTPAGPFEFVQVMDGSSSINRFFEVECRDDSCQEAQGMAERIIAEVNKVGAHVFTQYDEPSDYSQQLDKYDFAPDGYYAHIIEIGLPPDGLRDPLYDESGKKRDVINA